MSIKQSNLRSPRYGERLELENMTEAIRDPTASQKTPRNEMPRVPGFRDLKDECDSLECVVLGVSADHEVSHGKFIAKFGLNFSLLAETDS